MLRRRRSVLAAAVVVFALLAGALEGLFPHTDDGCRTEIHCIACRSLQGRTAVVAGPAIPAPAARVPELLPATESRPLPCAARRPAVSRGPPAAA
ncbi:MAG TPA: hypothetical protein VMR21_14265 [Vicinamibacteria bacterium]|nr:hypothetical protein [Vicinamibacteria bacterium]